MIEKAIAYIRVTKVMVTKRTGKRMILTDWALAYMAKSRGFPLTISATALLNWGSTFRLFKLLLFKPAFAVLIGKGVCLFENYTSCPTTNISISTTMALPFQLISRPKFHEDLGSLPDF